MCEELELIIIIYLKQNIFRYSLKDNFWKPRKWIVIGPVSVTMWNQRRWCPPKNDLVVGIPFPLELHNGKIAQKQTKIKSLKFFNHFVFGRLDALKSEKILTSISKITMCHK
jgi:hypothetical protein